MSQSRHTLVNFDKLMLNNQIVSVNSFGNLLVNGNNNTINTITNTNSSCLNAISYYSNTSGNVLSNSGLYYSQDSVNNYIQTVDTNAKIEFFTNGTSDSYLGLQVPDAQVSVRNFDQTPRFKASCDTNEFTMYNNHTVLQTNSIPTITCDANNNTTIANLITPNATIGNLYLNGSIFGIPLMSQITVSLSVNDILNLNLGKRILSSQGSDIIIVQAIEIQMRFNSIPYNGNGNLFINYDDDSNYSGNWLIPYSVGNLLTDTRDTYGYFLNTSTTQNSPNNNGINLFADSPLTNGNSLVKIRVTYFISQGLFN